MFDRKSHPIPAASENGHVLKAGFRKKSSLSLKGLSVRHMVITGCALRSAKAPRLVHNVASISDVAKRIGGAEIFKGGRSHLARAAKNYGRRWGWNLQPTYADPVLDYHVTELFVRRHTLEHVDSLFRVFV